MIIKELEVPHAQAGARIVEVNLDCIVLHANHPENVVHVDVHVVVVDLLRECRRSDRTGVQVRSDKGESTLMMAAIGTDELALTEAHVRSVRQLLRGSGLGVGSRATAEDVRQPDKSLEVGDLRRVVEAGKRQGRIQREVVDEDSKRSKWRDAPGDRVGLAITFILVVRMSHVWGYEPGPEYRACTRYVAKEGAPGGASTDVRCVHTIPFHPKS